MKCYIIKSYYLCLKLFKQNLLADTTIMHYQAILVSIKLENLIAGNIISQTLKKCFGLC